VQKGDIGGEMDDFGFGQGRVSFVLLAVASPRVNAASPGGRARTIEAIEPLTRPLSAWGEAFTKFAATSVVHAMCLIEQQQVSRHAP
jgi:hypothetical protein